MALIQSFHLEHLPASHTIHICLFRNVHNAAFLHQQLLAGNTDFEYAFVDASIVISKIHVLAAAYRAVNDLLENRLRSRNVHSEIVFCFSPNNNIAESFRRFGISPHTQNLLVVKISTPSRPFSAEAVQAHLGSCVEGEQVPFEDAVLAPMTDVGRVRKVYKISSGGGGGGKKGVFGGGDADEDGEARRELEVLVLGSLALRGATN